MTVNGLSSLKQKLRDMKDDLEDEVDDAVKDGLDSTKLRAKRNLVRQDAIHTGGVYRGFWQQRVETARGWRRTLTNEAPHAKFVERGTGDKGFYDAPSMSMQLYRNIRFWVQTKPSFRLGGRDPNVVALWISRSIAGRTPSPSGTLPQPFMGPAWQRGKRTVKRNVRTAVKQAVA